MVGSGVEHASAYRRPATATPWLIVAALVWVGFQSVQAPSASTADVPDTEFSTGRAMEHVTVIASEPHPMGSEANAAVRDYIVAEVAKLGLNAELYPTTALDYYGQGGSVSVVNVVARIPGEANTKAVALMAHYDTEPKTPGGNDNSAAVAVLLETARALTSGPPIANDVVLIFTDGEEPAPRFGASALIHETSVPAEIGLLVNFEAAGGSGPSLVAETSGPEGWIIQEFAAATPHPVAFSFLTELVGLMGDIGTDFDPFRNAGVPGLHLAYLRDAPIYHTSADDVGSVGLRSLAHHGAHALGIARHFGEFDLARLPDSGDSVFFTLRPAFVRYPAAWTVPLAVVAVTIFGWATVRMRRRRMATLRTITAAAGTTAAAAVAAALTGTIVWMVIVSVRSTPTVLESYLYLLLLLLIAGLVVSRITSRSRYSDPAAAVGGVVMFWIVLAAATAFYLPGSSYLFLWPVLAGSLIVLNYSYEYSPARWLRFAFVATPAIVLLTPAIDTFFQMAQPRPGNPDSEIAFVVFAPLLLALLVGALSWVAWRDPNPQLDQSA